MIEIVEKMRRPTSHFEILVFVVKTFYKIIYLWVCIHHIHIKLQN